MAEELSLKIKATRDELDRITDVVEGIGVREDWPPDLVFKVNLVLEEVAINIMDYAFVDESEEFEVTLSSDADAVTIVVCDSGKPFDPFTEAPPPDLDSPIDLRPVGGLGIHLVQTLMDKSSYRRTEGMNRLTMTKLRTGTSSEDQ